MTTMRNAKIVCTIGPASASPRVLEELVEAGMSVARINASHGGPDELIELLEEVNTVDERTPGPLATILDLQGPEIRTGELSDSVTLEPGDEVTFHVGTDVTPEAIGLSRSIEGVETGDRILLDDGRIECVVTDTNEAIQADVVTGGPLRNRLGVNVPGVDLSLEMVTEKDRNDLRLAATEGVDFVAASFVRDASDIYEVSGVLEEFGAETPIIAKIERADAVENLEGIIDAAYGVMVARGDLGVECPMEDVPLIQKRIIRRCREVGSPVITATEMLDSMVTARRPTRAEASDVANAVLDGTDALMLSAETAVGDHPVHVVATMDRIIREVEASAEYREVREQRIPPTSESRTDALARSGRFLARDLEASAIVAVSESGYTALKTAKYRPGVPIIAVTLSPTIYRQLAISWGLHPHLVQRAHPTGTEVIREAVRTTVERGAAASGDTVVVIAGMMSEMEGPELTNTLKVHVAAETLATGRVVVTGRVSGPTWRVDDGDLSSMPDGAVLLVPRSFDDEFSGDHDRIGGIISAEGGLTGYAAMVARELNVPMVSGAPLPDGLAQETIVTLDAERGVLYEGDIGAPSLRDERRRTG